MRAAAARRAKPKKPPRAENDFYSLDDDELLDHKDLLRSALTEHRVYGGSAEDFEEDSEFALEEKGAHESIYALGLRYPPTAVKGASGWIYHSTSFGCMRPSFCLRRLAIHIVESPPFDPLILTTIIVNCATMAWSSPLDPPGTAKQDLLARLETVYLAVFTFELVAKMIAYGVFFHTHSYLRDAWCQLDFVVVSLAWLPLLYPSMGNMSAIRSIRALRPLRALKRVPGMPKLVNSIIKSLPALVNVAMMTIFLILVFGIIGINLFKGILHRRCASEGAVQFLDDQEALAEYDLESFCAANVSVCLADEAACVYFEANPGGGTISFDSVEAAMYDTMMAFSPFSWVYFIAIALLGGLFLVNLFLAVIFDEFMRMQESDEAESEATKGASADANGGGPTAQLIPDGDVGSDGQAKQSICCDCTPRSGWRKSLMTFMLSKGVGNLSTALVVVNLMVMCMPYAGQPQWWDELTENIGAFITWIFIMEMFLKQIGMGCGAYWADSWNLLDGVIVWLSIGEIMLTMLLADTGLNISFLRTLRLIRLARLLKAWPGLYTIVKAFIKAVPQMQNVFILMFLLMVIGALLGMQAFGGKGVSEDSRWHFDYFYPAMMTVFSIFTGGWVDAYEACAEQVGVVAASLYFVPCLLIGFFIIMNLFIAILLDAFANAAADDQDDDSDDEKEEMSPMEKLKKAQQKIMEQKAKRRMSTGGKRRAVFKTKKETGNAVDDGADGIGADEYTECGLGQLSPLRVQCEWLVESWAFDNFILLLIFISTVTLVIDVPRLDPNSELKRNLTLLNYWITGFFVLEMLLKMVSYGVWGPRNAYLKLGWNRLDFFIVLISILGLLANIVPEFARLKSLRILRVLRPLRLLQRYKGMKLIIMSLVKTLPWDATVLGQVWLLHRRFDQNTLGVLRAGRAVGWRVVWRARP
jgi:voltage-dependent calcium channel L type alpha-1S